MNKALYALVFVFLALSGAGLYFELQLNDVRAVLTERAQIQEDYLIDLSKTIEDGKAVGDDYEIKLDVSPVEAQLVDAPDMTNVLDGLHGYDSVLEKTIDKTLDWSDAQRDALRNIIPLDENGKPRMNGSRMAYEGSEGHVLLETLVKKSSEQRTRLNNTRAGFEPLRSKLSEVVGELNGLKPVARQLKVTVAEQEEKIGQLEGEKSELEDQIQKIKGQIDDLNGEITSLKDEVNAAKDETEVAREDLDKSQKLVEQLKKMIADMNGRTGGSSADNVINQIPAGVKGKVIDCDNEKMFVTIEFTEDAMKELKGDDLSKPLPHIELGVTRKGFNGPAGEFVGKIRLRQEFKGEKIVVADIIGAWVMGEIKDGDEVYAE